LRAQTQHTFLWVSQALDAASPTSNIMGFPPFCKLRAALVKARQPTRRMPDRQPKDRGSHGTVRLAALEEDPSINQIRLRENGPYVVNARIALSGYDGTVRRRTLCRCGASRSKPLCDGSHSAVTFNASGEPPTQPCKPREQRDGTQEIIPLRDGPREVKGSVELVSGTGRTFAKSVHCLLCRCGGARAILSFRKE
jgi:CDGSH-type Zn-finger protein